MSKLSILIHLNAYSDPSSSNNPSLGNFKWSRDVSSIAVSNPTSQSVSLAPSETKTLFSGSRTLSQDNTTEYTLSLKPLTSNTYVLTAVSGTMPDFRTPRSIGTDATTQVTVTQNGPLLTFTSTSGTLFNTAAIQVGDFTRIGSLFATSNQGEFKILSKTSTSFTIENLSGTAEGPITLGAGFADQIQVYSASGVQKNDTLVINSGFSSASFGSYSITDVAANYLEFYSTSTLPVETAIQTQVSIYSVAKSLVYVECDQKATLTINNGEQIVKLEPLVIGSSTKPGVFLLSSTVYSLDIQNNSLNSANAFLASVE